MDNITKKIILITALASIIISAGANDEVESLEQVNFAYNGDETRLGLGITEEGEIIGDFLKSFNTTYRSNWMGQAWYSDGAGGLELDYHWINTDNEQSLIDNAADFKINKLFLAIDQNIFDDRKVTIGGGREANDKFWNAYASKATTGERLFRTVPTDFTQVILVGSNGNHVTNQVINIEDVTRTFKHPYDWGVGGRVGKFFNTNLFRLTGGLDYETGDFSSNQLTASIDVEKYFYNTGHSLALHVEQLNRDGDFVNDSSDTRASLMYRYDFGQTYQPTERSEKTKMVKKVTIIEPEKQQQVVLQNEVDLASTAFFDLDSAELRADTIVTLRDVANQIKSSRLGSKINIVGHTCWLGSQSYNQKLSEARAKAAQDFFVAQGIDATILHSIGKGELEPAYDNKGPEIGKNRRVAISFLSIETDYQEATTTYTEKESVTWVKTPINTPPSWMARALRNPAKHKRTVDVYQYKEDDTIETAGPVIELNSLPFAAADTLAVTANSTATLIDVLANDSDPENDSLTITDVTQPANGSVINNGDSLTYTPNAGFSGADTFAYIVDDGHGGQATGQVAVTVGSLNQAPVAVDDMYVVNLNAATTISPLSNDNDPDGDALTIESVDTSSLQGTLTLNSDGTMSYVPAFMFRGNDIFTYTISDGNGGTATATVTLCVFD